MLPSHVADGVAAAPLTLICSRRLLTVTALRCCCCCCADRRIMSLTLPAAAASNAADSAECWRACWLLVLWLNAVACAAVMRILQLKPLNTGAVIYAS
jgi:hypothetical protein